MTTMKTYAEALENSPITVEIYTKYNTPCVYLSTENRTGCEYPVASIREVTEHFEEFLSNLLADITK